MEANRDQAPDFIPDHILNESELEARITVVSSRYLRDIRAPGLIQRSYARSLAGRSDLLAPLCLAVVAIAATATWIATAPESEKLFVLASTTTVLAIVVLARSASVRLRHLSRRSQLDD